MPQQAQQTLSGPGSAAAVDIQSKSDIYSQGYTNGVCILISQLTLISRRLKHLPGVTVFTLALWAGAAMAQAPLSVPVFKAERQRVGSGFELDGVVQPVRQSVVSAQASGRLASLNVKVGDRIRAGQVLATIDDRETQAGVQRSQAQVAQAQADLRNAQSNFDRTRNLQRQGFVSSAAMDSAEAQLKAAQAAYDQALAGARQASLYQGFTKVTAPFDAWVLQTLVEAGDLAVPGKPILSLYAPLPLRVVVQVPVSRSAQVAAAAKADAAVSVQLDSGSAVRPTQVSQVPNADPVSQTIEWRLGLPDAQAAKVLPGQQVRVRFSLGQSASLLVPSSAILRRGELTAVYVAAEKNFTLRAVRPGADRGEKGVEILSGLTEGELVALDPVRAGLFGAQPQAK